MNNIAFNYMYRDASNYKNAGEVVFENDLGIEDEEEISDLVVAFLEDGEYFVAELVDIDTCYFGGIYDDDHGYHEFTGVEMTEEKPSDYYRQPEPMRTFSEFLKELEEHNKTGWIPVRNIIQKEYGGFEVTYEYE